MSIQYLIHGTLSLRVMRHIETDKKGKLEEIKNQIKLLKWEQPNSHLSMERFKVARHKLWKTVKKFNVSAIR